MRAICISRLVGTVGLALALAAPCAAEEKWGTVKGQVTWSGKVVPVPPAFAPEGFIVNPRNNGLKNVFVWLIDVSNPSKPTAPPINPALKAAKEVEITIQAGPPRRFEPHALVMEKQQLLALKNPTAESDNVITVGNAMDNPSMVCNVLAGKVTKIGLSESRWPIFVGSTIDPKMKAWVMVFDHPYFALTNADGKFEIKGAPAGEYNIVMWQEAIGWVNGGKIGRKITIPAGKVVEVNGQPKEIP
jgi:hypothetical protein